MTWLISEYLALGPLTLGRHQLCPAAAAWKAALAQAVRFASEPQNSDMLDPSIYTLELACQLPEYAVVSEGLYGGQQVTYSGPLGIAFGGGEAIASFALSHITQVGSAGALVQLASEPSLAPDLPPQYTYLTRELGSAERFPADGVVQYLADFSAAGKRTSRLVVLPYREYKLGQHYTCYRRLGWTF